MRTVLITCLSLDSPISDPEKRLYAQVVYWGRILKNSWLYKRTQEGMEVNIGYDMKHLATVSYSGQGPKELRYLHTNSSQIDINSWRRH